MEESVYPTIIVSDEVLSKGVASVMSLEHMVTEDYLLTAMGIIISILWETGFF